MKRLFYKKCVALWLCAICWMICSTHVMAQISDELPEGWSHADIGEPEIQSKFFYDESTGTYEISAGGKDMWGSRDDGHFLYFETEEDKEVVVRVLGITGGEWNAKVTIMIRSGFDYDAAMSLVEFRKDNVTVFYYRPSEGSFTAGDRSFQAGSAPWWLKFVRQGSYVSAFQKADNDTAQWQQLGTPVRLAFRGTAYMGVAVCGGGSGLTMATGKVDNLAVQDIENPYIVTTPVANQTLNEGETKSINVTSLFGHFIGDYWTIQPTSTDGGVVTASFYEEAVPESQRTDGEPYKKYLRLHAVKDGVAAIKLTANVMGYRMNTEFLVDVKGTSGSESVISMEPPTPWKFVEVLTPAKVNVPYNGPHNITKDSDLKLDARNFDQGGEGVAYHDNDASSSATNYSNYGRPQEGVDIGNANNIGGTNTGEWLAYTVNVQDAGLYNLAINLSVNNSNTKFHYEINGRNVTGTLTAPGSGGWANWYDFNTPIYLQRGEQVIKFYMEAAGFDLRYFTFSYQAPWSGLESWMEYTTSVNDRLKIVTLQNNSAGLGDASAFLYQKVLKEDQLEMKMYVDTVKNTGTGAFAGFMLRESLDGGQPFVSFGVGAYEGLKLSYKWGDDVAVTARTVSNVAQPCWILLRKYKDNYYGNNMLTIYYSYDNIYWTEVLKYPLTVDFLKQDLYAGVALTGGSYTNNERKGVGVMKNMKLNINRDFETIESVDNIGSLKEPLKMAPTVLSAGSVATITYKVIKPGKVTITVYDSYGQPVQTLLSESKSIGTYTLSYTANLPRTGVYLLRVVSNEDYQYIKFVYN